MRMHHHQADAHHIEQTQAVLMLASLQRLSPRLFKMAFNGAKKICGEL